MGEKIWFDHGTSNTKGVGILLSKNCQMTVHNVIKSDEGRFLILYVTWKCMKIVLANIYAPNRDSPEFFQKTFKEIERFTPNYCIIAGDFNLSREKGLDRMGTTFNNNESADWLNTHIESQDCVDVWRRIYPDKHGFTWRKKRQRAFSRLDYIIVNDAFTQFIDNIQIIPSFHSDHALVELSVVFEPNKRGTGYWKLNVSHLSNSDYVEKINKLLDIEMEGVKTGEYRIKWELIKIAVNGLSLQYAAHKQKSRKNKMIVLEKKTETP